MKYVIEPRFENDPLKYFQELTQIPRGSGNEKAVSDYVAQFAKSLGLWCEQDSAYNVYIKKDGVGDGKNKPAVLFQGHLDMVCEKNNDTDFDFLTQPLNLEIENGWLSAKGTTLGADDGVAIAYMMSLLSENFENAPPLQCLCTTNEETGMDGAFAADMSLFSAEKMINLDCGPEGKFTVSCAGGKRTTVTKTVKRKKCDWSVVKISIGGLQGGHSGSDINKERGNANKLMARVLYNLLKNQEIKLISISGGDKDNAIPRECVCEVAAQNVHNLKQIVQNLSTTFADELASSDSGIVIDIEEKKVSQIDAISEIDTKNIVNLLMALPNGPVHRNIKLNDLVVSSNNVAVVSSNSDSVMIDMSMRSSIQSLKDDIVDQIEILSNAFDAKFVHSSEYPGWAFDEKSELRDLCFDIYKDMYGENPTIEAIHAGLECGLLKEKSPKMDIVAMGPLMQKIHTPEERLNLESFVRMYDYLKKIINSF